MAVLGVFVRFDDAFLNLEVADDLDFLTALLDADFETSDAGEIEGLVYVAPHHFETFGEDVSDVAMEIACRADERRGAA